MKLFKVKAPEGDQYILANNITKALKDFPEPKPECESILIIDYLQVDLSDDLKQLAIIDADFRKSYGR